MNRRLQHKNKIYKRLCDDVWGKLAISKRYSKALQHVAYTYVNDPEKRQFYQQQQLRKFLIWKTKDNNNFMSWMHQARNTNLNFSYDLNSKNFEFRLQKKTNRSRSFWDGIKLKKYYGDKRSKQFKFFKKQVNRHRRLSGPGVLTFLETRLDAVLFRTNLFDSVYEIRQHINHKRILVNGKFVQKQGFTVKRGDIISLKSSLYIPKYKNLVNNLESNRVLANYPPYLEINYKIGCIVIIRQPRLEEIKYPFRKTVFGLRHAYSSVMN